MIIGILKEIKTEENRVSMTPAGVVGDIYRNEALAGEVFFIHGGLRLGSKG